jgi:hypothetical protein
MKYVVTAIIGGLAGVALVAIINRTSLRATILNS